MFIVGEKERKSRLHRKLNNSDGIRTVCENQIRKYCAFSRRIIKWDMRTLGRIARFWELRRGNVDYT
ncbi:hypothetical protein D4R42_02880 [bacterium]|nr:MAG: hypothetical protein D4R42_02880 [bacterium]